jgi:aminopeptidase 2
LVLSEAGIAGDDNVISEAKKRYRQFMNGEHEVLSPDLRSVVYKTMLKQANDENEENQVWEEIFNIYNDESFPMDQRVIALTSLGNGIKSKNVIAKTLSLIVDEKLVRTQDAWLSFRS